jgi:hypothetical protein
MLKRVLLVALTVILGNVLFAQSFDFSVKTGTSIQGANFGYNLNEKFSIYTGFDVIGISIDLEGEDSDFDNWNNNYWLSEEKWNYSASVLLFMPRLGCKYKLSQNKLVPYFYTDLFKSFASADVTGKYEEWEWYDGDLEYYNLDKIDSKKEEKALSEFLGFWGTNFGFGVEYPISKNFGVSGEFGFRMLFSSTDYTDSSSSNYGNEQWGEDWNSELAATFKITTTSISVNYHF